MLGDTQCILILVGWCARKKENAAGPADDMENSELINKHIGSTDKNLNDEPASSVLYSEPYLTGNPSIAATCDMYIKAQDREFPVNSSLIIIHSKVLGKKILESKKNLGSSALPLVACLPKESQADIQLLLEVLYCYRTRINTVSFGVTESKYLFAMFDLYIMLQQIQKILCL